MKIRDSLSENRHFQETSLFLSFKNKPLGFIDAGAAEGVHPLILPAASLVHCTCFEPDRMACQKLLEDHQSHPIFAAFSLFDVALGREEAVASLYVTESPVNSSLLKPLSMLVDRYGTKGFNVAREEKIRTKSLDQIIYEDNKSDHRLGEFIKLDCQGAEYEILQGGLRTLDEQCVALWCEVEFFPMYENQMTFPDVDLFLRQRGFRLYGLYPHYISAKRLNRRVSETEERIVWADALYFKDPLDELNKRRTFTGRELEVLILAAILTEYYDYAHELIFSLALPDRERELLANMVMELAAKRKESFMADLAKLTNDFQKSPENGYLLAKKFVDHHTSNSNVDFIQMNEDIYDQR